MNRLNLEELEVKVKTLQVDKMERITGGSDGGGSWNPNGMPGQ